MNTKNIECEHDNHNLKKKITHMNMTTTLEFLCTKIPKQQNYRLLNREEFTLAGKKMKKQSSNHTLSEWLN